MSFCARACLSTCSKVSRTQPRVPSGPANRPIIYLPRRGFRLTGTASEVTGSKSRISTVFGALIVLGIGSTCYGLYQFYSMFTMWPPEVRKDLRAGIKAKHQDNLELSEGFLRRAWETAQNLPITIFSPDPYLKLSGIAITLAEVLEQRKKPDQAYDVLESAHDRLQSALRYGRSLEAQREAAMNPKDQEKREEVMLSGKERMRAVAIASKLGEMADLYQQPVELEERWLTWAVNETLKTLKDSQGGRKSSGTDKEDEKEKQTELVLSELELPQWVTKTDVGAPLEALGAFYAKVGKIEYAMPLYLHAISFLVPPPTSRNTSSPEDACRAAQLMSNLSELIMRSGPPTPERLHQAEAWAKQALGLIQKTEGIAKKDSQQLTTCEDALGVVLFNLASLRELNEDRAAAKELFLSSLEQLKRVNSKDGVVEVKSALRRLDRMDRVAARTSTKNEKETSGK